MVYAYFTWHLQEIAKNKRERQRIREEVATYQDPDKLKEHIRRLKNADSAGRLDSNGKKKLEQLQKSLRLCMENKKEATASESEDSDVRVDMSALFGSSDANDARNRTEIATSTQATRKDLGNDLHSGRTQFSRSFTGEVPPPPPIPPPPPGFPPGMVPPHAAMHPAMYMQYQYQQYMAMYAASMPGATPMPMMFPPANGPLLPGGTPSFNSAPLLPTPPSASLPIDPLDPQYFGEKRSRSSTENSLDDDESSQDVSTYSFGNNATAAVSDEVSPRIKPPSPPKAPLKPTEINLDSTVLSFRPTATKRRVVANISKALTATGKVQIELASAGAKKGTENANFDVETASDLEFIQQLANSTSGTAFSTSDRIDEKDAICEESVSSGLLKANPILAAPAPVVGTIENDSKVDQSQTSVKKAPTSAPGPPGTKLLRASVPAPPGMRLLRPSVPGPSSSRLIVPSIETDTAHLQPHHDKKREAVPESRQEADVVLDDEVASFLKEIDDLV